MGAALNRCLEKRECAKRSDGCWPNQNAQLTFRGLPVGTHRQADHRNEDERAVESSDDLRSIHGSILWNQMLPGAGRAVFSFRDQRTLLRGVLPSGTALRGTPECTPRPDRPAADPSLDKSSLGVKRVWRFQVKPEAFHAWLSSGMAAWHCSDVRKKHRVEVATRSHIKPLFQNPCLWRGFRCSG